MNNENIVHELQVKDVLKDDELSEIPGDTGGNQDIHNQNKNRLPLLYWQNQSDRFAQPVRPVPNMSDRLSKPVRPVLIKDAQKN